MSSVNSRPKNRNKILESETKAPANKFKKTGTTIIGLKFADGVIIAADTRATGGTLVMQKNCQKIRELAPNMVGAGCGTAADMEATGRIT